MSGDIPNTLRELVAPRSSNRCEYCQIPQSVSAHKDEADHIIPRQHGGATNADNLAFACLRCNRRKGPNIGSFDPSSGFLTPFFHPRTQKWHEHFRLNGSLIQPLTPEARVTIKILDINSTDRVAERRLLIKAGLYHL